jgi:hypothetical protein
LLFERGQDAQNGAEAQCYSALASAFSDLVCRAISFHLPAHCRNSAIHQNFVEKLKHADTFSLPLCQCKYKSGVGGKILNFGVGIYANICT